MIQPNYGVLSCTKTLNASGKIRVEGAFKDLDEVKKPISLSAKAFMLSKEVKDGLVLVKSKVVFNLVYLSEDGYKRASCDVDGTVELSLENAIVHVFVTDVKLLSANGFVGVCTLNCRGDGRSQIQNDVLVGGDGLCLKSKDVYVDIYNNERSGQKVISDEFSIDFTVGEVLSYNAVAYVTSASSQMGRVILDGEAVLTVKVLPFSENNDIVKERRVIPFRYELEDGDALQGDKAYGFVSVDATSVKVFADEGRERSVVTADITLGFTGGSVTSSPLTIVEDAYLKLNECEISKEEVSFLTCGEQRRMSEKIQCVGGASVEGGRIVAVMGENLTVVSIKQVDGTLVLDGVVNADVIFKNADNGIVSVACECPISLDMSIGGLAQSLRVVLTDMSARVRNGEIELECHVSVQYSEFSVQTVTCVTDVKELGLRDNLDGSICICVARKGDDLWDVAKRLGSDEDEILRFNQELEFPLVKDERIIIYRQKI